MLQHILDFLALGKRARNRTRRQLQEAAMKAAGQYPKEPPATNRETELKLFLDVIKGSLPHVDLSQGPRDLDKIDAYLRLYVENHDRYPPMSIIRGTIYFIGQLIQERYPSLKWDRNNRSLFHDNLYISIAAPVEDRIQGLNDIALQNIFENAISQAREWHDIRKSGLHATPSTTVVHEATKDDQACTGKGQQAPQNHSTAAPAPAPGRAKSAHPKQDAGTTTKGKTTQRTPTNPE